MVIGIDASRANRRPRTGVEWYAYHLLQELKKIAPNQRDEWRLYTNESLQDGLEGMPKGWQEKRVYWPIKYLWTQAALSIEMMRHEPDVLFVPAHVLPRIYPKKTVVTIHDVGFRRYPKLYKPIQIAYHELTTREIVKAGSRIITVSEFCKQEIVEQYQADPDQIFVTPLGFDQTTYQPAEEVRCQQVKQKYSLQKPFFLFTGRWELKKNIQGLIAAFEIFAKENQQVDHELILTGLPGSGWKEIEKSWQASPVKERIRFIGYVSEQEKVALLSSAEAYIHPAWYEGFGLPPLEAMACDCPVICSSAASLPEVVGEKNALWFAPDQSQQAADRMAQLISDSNLRTRLIANGSAWAKHYTWQKTAEKTLPILTNWS